MKYIKKCPGKTKDAADADAIVFCKTAVASFKHKSDSIVYLPRNTSFARKSEYRLKIKLKKKKSGEFIRMSK